MTAQTSPEWTTIWLALVLAAAVILLAGAPLPHTDADVHLYAKAAKNIVSSGDWITLRHQTDKIDVPPLTIWFMAASLSLWGDTNAALRWWHLLMTLALVLVTYKIARLHGDREEGLLAALLLITQQQIFSWGLNPKQDIPLTVFIAFAFYAYLRYRRIDQARFLALSSLSLALAVLSKGLVAIPMFGVVVAADIYIGRIHHLPRRKLKWTALASGLVVFLGVAAPWFVLGALRSGEGFLQIILLRESPAAGFFQHNEPSSIPYLLEALVYVPMLLVAVFPWSGLGLAAVREGNRALQSTDHSYRFCAVWVIVLFLILSLSPGGKIMRYLLTLSPPFAILAGRVLLRAVVLPSGLRGMFTILLSLWIPMQIFLLWQVRAGSPELQLYLPILLPALVAFSFALLAGVAAAAWGRSRTAIALLAAGTLASYGLVQWEMMRQWERLWPWSKAAAVMEQSRRPGDLVMVVGEIAQERHYLNYYLSDFVAAPVDEAAFLRAWHRGGVVAALSPEVKKHLRDEMQPVLLFEMPSGWVMVTNH